MKENIICPNCKNECFVTLDEWGRTPFHIHCKNCNINIGCTNIKKGVKILQQYHIKNTYIEFYDNKIHKL